MKTIHYIPKVILCLLIVNYQLSFVNCVSAQTITTVAGNHALGYSGDGGPATAAEFENPYGVASDALGNYYIADYENGLIRKVNTSGIISTYAGNHSLGKGYSGDGGPATAAKMTSPTGVAVDGAGNLYFTDSQDEVVRMVNTSGIINTVAGNFNYGQGFSGNGGPATLAELSHPLGVAVDASGNIYIADNANSVVRMVNTSGVINAFAGDYAFGPGFRGDGGPATAAKLQNPYGLAFDKYGDLYIADEGNYVVREVNTSGIINTVAGNNAYGNGYSGDGGPATAAEFYYPVGIAFDTSGNYYISDYNNNVIREVNQSGIISTVAGNFQYGKGYSGDGGAATNAELNLPMGLAFDASNHLFITDMQNIVIRQVSGLCDLWVNHYLIQDVSCQSGDNGSASVSLLSGTMPYTFLWNNGGTGNSITGLTAGSYSVNVMDATGCNTKGSVSVTINPPTPPNICYVTVDTVSHYNVVVWQKAGIDTNSIDSIFILRQTGLNNFTRIGEISVHGPTIDTDVTSLPNTLSYDYTLGTIVTGCGYGDTSADLNRTILLQSNTGNGKVNLNWNDYIGQTVDYYRILKDSLGNGNWRMLDSVPFGNTLYTDYNPGNSPNLRYIINTEWNVSCKPFMLSSPHRHSNRDMHYILNINDESYSNTSYVYNITGINHNGMNSGIEVYPNPSSGQFTIVGTQNFVSNIEIYNMLGEKVYSSILPPTLPIAIGTGALSQSAYQINLSSQPNGIYLYRALNEDGTLIGSGKLIIE